MRMRRFVDEYDVDMWFVYGIDSPNPSLQDRLDRDPSVDLNSPYSPFGKDL